MSGSLRATTAVPAATIAHGTSDQPGALAQNLERDLQGETPYREALALLLTVTSGIIQSNVTRTLWFRMSGCTPIGSGAPLSANR